MRKQKLCPHCNGSIGQGHRVDRCQKRKFPKTYNIASNRIYVPEKRYKEKNFERNELPNAIIYQISSGNFHPSSEVTNEVGMEVYAQSIHDIKTFAENKWNSFPAKLKAKVNKSNLKK